MLHATMLGQDVMPPKIACGGAERPSGAPDPSTGALWVGDMCMCPDDLVWDSDQGRCVQQQPGYTMVAPTETAPAKPASPSVWDFIASAAGALFTPKAPTAPLPQQPMPVVKPKGLSTGAKIAIGGGVLVTLLAVAKLLSKPKKRASSASSSASETSLAP